ncbi:hypothetical protein QWY77_13530 [Thalassotalea ponticola]|uniref:DUF4097 family beta strand repeat-containing protein n=1 Tax=Thalassotalea ponticola TaxID=1523392 RepID=UPI0025B562F0|nr:hypothetical protein [Thalassotalea ponticola]MDN3653761.1 hypothetical protein [Thalassotalea ponticola]
MAVGLATTSSKRQLDIDLKREKQMNVTSIRYLILFAVINTVLFTVTDTRAQQISQSQKVTADARIVIENLRGKVSVHTTDSELVEVTGTLDPEAIEFVFTVNGKDVRIEVKMPKQLGNEAWLDQQSGSDLLIKVPSRASVIGKGISTDFELTNLQSNTQVNTVSGSITANKLSSQVTLETVSGNIVAEQLTGDVRLSTVSGSIDEQGSRGRVEYRAVSGKIRAQTEASNVNASVVSGSMKLHLAKAVNANISSVNGALITSAVLTDDSLLNLSSINGPISLALADDVSVDITAVAGAGGRIINDLDSTAVKKVGYRNSKELNTRLGDGSALVKASTISGKLHLSKR